MIQTLIGLGASFAIPSLMKRLKDQKVQVLHAMPGRVRLQSDHWKDDHIAVALEEQFSTISIVKNVRASGTTGSLLIEFTTPHLTSQQFDEVVQLAVDTSTRAYRHVDASLTKSMRHGVDSLDQLIKKQTGAKTDLDSLIVLGLLVKGTTGFATNPAFASSLLYWAYTILKREDGGSS
ncbi:hypothetical protein N781_04945 [Pontibacillus halophilus JSM 076056 = DSM 19796]|uniref:Uncharacterized protein n=1 Tax=Pontibacillus halophilus JSM 076056 = DSM 19796 TaxID=1385510 RepID=A0A0A5GCY4_9BACI|nr:hypothetical protein [Pontibacillus halophilus]KGX91061.1 hypothetical protein N781_04945 [Pontibacillus halophilus JSM 076056 = DSM 19796]